MKTTAERRRLVEITARAIFESCHAMSWNSHLVSDQLRGYYRTRAEFVVRAQEGAMTGHNNGFRTGGRV